jgi:hypothetical protein
MSKLNRWRVAVAGVLLQMARGLCMECVSYTTGQAVPLDYFSGNPDLHHCDHGRRVHSRVSVSIAQNPNSRADLWHETLFPPLWRRRGLFTEPELHGLDL